MKNQPMPDGKPTKKPTDSYLNLYRFQKETANNNYKQYTVEDYHKLQKEMNVSNFGNLGPSFDNDTLDDKVNFRSFGALKFEPTEP